MSNATGTHWPVWDRPVRFIHWYFPVAISFMWWSGTQGYMRWHSWCGYTLLIATATRLSWGLVGSHYARFSQFLKTPATVWRHIRGAQFDGVGHNPLGGYSTLVMLFLIVAQGLTGLASSDDILFEGPLAYWATTWAPGLSEWHEINWTILSCAIALHLTAIAFYSLVRKQALISAMWRGYSPGREGAVRPVNAWRAVALAFLWALLLTTIIALAPESPSYY